jgi:hypothetical protein
MKKVALILTGYPDDAEVSLPYYLRQIAGSVYDIDIFASIHADRGHRLYDLAKYESHFYRSKIFIKSHSEQQLLMMLSRGHTSIAEFAAAVNHWRSELSKYDMVWRGRWDSYLVGDSSNLDFLIEDCWNIGNVGARADAQRYRVLTRSLVLQHGRPAMEGKHHWATVPTVLAAFDNWQDRWNSWITRIGSFRFDAHLTWAEIYASIGAHVSNGHYTVNKAQDAVEIVGDSTKIDRDIKISASPTGIYNDALTQQNFHQLNTSAIHQVNAAQTRHEIHTRQQQRRLALKQKIKSQNPH